MNAFKISKQIEDSRPTFGLDEVGILLVGHGTRCESGQNEFRQLFEHFAELVKPIACGMANLEHAEPDIPQALANLIAKSRVQRLLVVPALLFTAGHALVDIPKIVQEAAAEFDIEIMGQTEPIECSEEVVLLSARRFQEAVGSGDTSKATWILVGRGSSDPSVATKLGEFVRLRQERTSVHHAFPAFIYGQQPSVLEAMDQSARSNSELVVVQPHLLFSGKLLDQLRRQVEQRQNQNTRPRWILTEPLGADPKIAELLAVRAKKWIAVQSDSFL